MKKQDLLRTYYDLIADRKFDDAVSMFRADGDIVWSIPGRGPLAGKYESKNTIRDVLQRFHDGSYGEIKRIVHAICLADDDEHVCVQYLLRMERQGQICDVVAIDAWHVDGDQLAEAWTFFETLHDFDGWTA